MVVQVVIRLIGAGDALVRCMFRISLASPNFHSVSESCCMLQDDRKNVIIGSYSRRVTVISKSLIGLFLSYIGVQPI